MRASEFITENRPANYPGGFSKNRAGKYTFNLDRRKLNVPELIKRGAIFVTYPHGDNGWETDAKLDWQRSILTLYNVLFDGGWTSEAKKYLKPQSYKKAEQDINSSAPNLGSDESVYDGKYNQILWSIKKLGIPDSVAFLDNQDMAEGILNEIYKMPPTNNSSQGMAIWAYTDALEKKSSVIYKDNNVIIFKFNEDLLRYIILQDGNPVLYIGLSKFLDGYKSGTVATEIAGRGKGLAQKAYLNASDILSVPIYSDTTQTDASRLGIWDKLIQQYPDRIVGYDQKTNKNLPLSMTDKGPVVNQNQPVYVDKKNSNRQATPTQRYRTRLLKLLPKKQGVAEGLEDLRYLPGLVDLPVFASPTRPSRTAKVVNTGYRIMAVLNVRGVNIPYYISTGEGGKASVPTGRWYPVFGKHESGWLNKAGEKAINAFYGSKELALGATKLNYYLGDLSSIESQIPIMTKNGNDIINKDLQPMSHSEASANPEEFKKRVNSFLARLGSEPYYKVNSPSQQPPAVKG